MGEEARLVDVNHVRSAVMISMSCTQSTGPYAHDEYDEAMAALNRLSGRMRRYERLLVAAKTRLLVVECDARYERGNIVLAEEIGEALDK